ncbi:hypothetical protein, variant [Phytophthora nicotianae CJ01A1]|nr:hypothetical protein, variant [Phytophthora nicotianae INRA-310]ETI34619.1 hypothetical protein, variant [Phytophthora nicotianae P1569]ETK74961.1 hypothetical protein, variant [Phytophthora nicotianae]ETO63414.1 hypothetical protein, variant [Phytophthora nicotianae P1976]ETP04516.1 hypothetical protein, variant [Phytophthora nicotianae CJ01A1]ETP32662.1 hypothetical protein, variant [Phytophthora nicotianae P10297]
MLDWEDEFVSLESKELCDLAKVASNLDIQPLVDLTCRSIAQIMSATSEADELRKKFGLEDPPDVECSCELRSDMAGFDFDMFNTLDHDLSTEEYELVEFDQPSVDELVSFINGSGSNPNATSNIQQQAKKNCHLHGENSSDPGDSNNGSTSSKKKRKKRKKKKTPPPSHDSSDQIDTKSSTAIQTSATESTKQNQESSSSDEKEEPDPTPTKSSSARNGKSKPQTLEEKVRLARQNPSAVFKESQFEDDDDEDMAKVIKMFELNLESAYRDCDKKKKPRLDFAPREVFRSSLVQSSQFEYVQRRLSATMT